MPPVSQTDKTPVTKTSVTPLPGQYEYSSFEGLLLWVDQCIKVHPTLATDFQRLISLRQHYISEDNQPGITSIENIIKNEVGIRILVAEIPNFEAKYSGWGPTFYQGRFIGWKDEIRYDSKMKGMQSYGM